ncbi:hypothetical protein PQX77_014725 [Marasmius sp. AFHP31]|nr:hypothetical protein PQX77_014725 [Marasmius sp. AFHP31]
MIANPGSVNLQNELDQLQECYMNDEISKEQFRNELDRIGEGMRTKPPPGKNSATQILERETENQRPSNPVCRALSSNASPNPTLAITNHPSPELREQRTVRFQQDVPPHIQAQLASSSRPPVASTPYRPENRREGASSLIDLEEPLIHVGTEDSSENRQDSEENKEGHDSTEERGVSSGVTGRDNLVSAPESAERAAEKSGDLAAQPPNSSSLPTPITNRSTVASSPATHPPPSSTPLIRSNQTITHDDESNEDDEGVANWHKKGKWREGMQSKPPPALRVHGVNG